MVFRKSWCSFQGHFTGNGERHSMFNTVNPQIEVFKVIMKDIGSNIPLLVNYTSRFLLGYSKFTLGDVPYLIYHSYETW